jgi:hypothetical protein
VNISPILCSVADRPKVPAQSKFCHRDHSRFATGCVRRNDVAAGRITTA